MTTDSKTHPLQKFTVKRIHRSQIKEAVYNPRSITDDARKRLKNNLENRGILETLVWNETTGNLVSGHQRLGILDQYHQRKFKNIDYELDVAAVILTEKEEVEQNILFNNARAMGQFDDEKLLDIFKAMPDFDPLMAGMNEEDISFFGITQDLDNMDDSAIEDQVAQFEQIKKQKVDLVPEDVKQAKKAEVKAAKKEQTKNEVDLHVTLTFSNQADKRAFMRKIGEPEAQMYIKGEIFVAKYFAE